MTIEGFDQERVTEIAALARLSVSAEEARELGPQFAAILAQFQVLADLDVAGEEPMAGPLPPTDILRRDEPVPGLTADTLLAAAPDRRDDFYGVPRAIGGEEQK